MKVAGDDRAACQGKCAGAASQFAAAHAGTIYKTSKIARE
jgi:hypothetical protein